LNKDPATKELINLTINPASDVALVNTTYDLSINYHYQGPSKKTI